MEAMCVVIPHAVILFSITEIIIVLAMTIILQHHHLMSFLNVLLHLKTLIIIINLIEYHLYIEGETPETTQCAQAFNQNEASLDKEFEPHEQNSICKRKSVLKCTILSHVSAGARRLNPNQAKRKEFLNIAQFGYNLSMDGVKLQLIVSCMSLRKRLFLQLYLFPFTVQP